MRLLGEITCAEAAASLAPAGQVICQATYVLTQADIDAGEVTNSATANGTPPGTDEPITSAPDDAIIPGTEDASLSVVKTANVTQISTVGEEIVFSFLITNTGNVTINDARVIETDFSGSGELSAITCAPGAAALAPGTSVNCTATYRTTQADVNAGKVSNTAVASGTPVTGGDPVPSDPSTVSVKLTPGPTLAVTGGEIATGVIAIAFMLLIGGGVLMVIRRRRQDAAAI